MATIRGKQRWVVVLVLFWITSVVESLGVSQVLAFLPLYLREIGLPAADVPQWVGVLNSLVFVLGLPLVPLWGVWADKYSRKAVIIRSALVEAVFFGAVAASRDPLQLAGSMALVGFQLGNTGVMLSLLRDITPPNRLGTAIALFGASGPVGFATGAAFGGFLVDGAGWPIWSMYAVSSVLSLATALMLTLLLREVRPEVVPAGPVLALAYGAMRGVLFDRTTLRLFGIFGVSLLARSMANPFMPIVTEQVNGGPAGAASAIALVVGTAALVGGLISPLAGAIGDRVGFRPVLTVSLIASGFLLTLMPTAPSVAALAALNVVFSTLTAAITAMVFGLLAVEVAPERRSATLNLVYLPGYLTGIVGPAAGAVIVTTGISNAFLVAGLVLVLGTVLAAGSRPGGAVTRQG